MFAVIHRKRFDFASYVRCLADNVWDDVETEEEDEELASEAGEEMDVDRVHLKRPGRNYRNQVCRSFLTPHHFPFFDISNFDILPPL